MRIRQAFKRKRVVAGTMITAARIKAFRKFSGLTQADLADQWGVSVRTLSRWERGEGRPAEWMRRELARSVPPLEWPTAPAFKAMVENYPRPALLWDSNLKVLASEKHHFRWAARAGVELIGTDWHKHLSEWVRDMLSDNGGFSSLIRNGMMCIRGTYPDDPPGLVGEGFVDCTVIRIPDYGAICTVILREPHADEDRTPLRPYFAD
ncbi:helix-turn-helix domain-containing protein [Rhizobium daejeonense]